MNPTVRQTRFVLPIADDVRLVSVDTARAACGETAEDIVIRFEDHKRADYLPAFDLSVDGPGAAHRREVRIWAGALRGSGITETDSIIADCLLTNTTGLANREFHLNASQLERAWCVSNQTVLRLITIEELRGVRVGRNWRVNRFSAAEFLRSRIL